MRSKTFKKAVRTIMGSTLQLKRFRQVIDAEADRRPNRNGGSDSMNEPESLRLECISLINRISQKRYNIKLLLCGESRCAIG
ncbi:hypothetical protein NDI45_12890 [Leptolyngbya sp. GB1-A1]|uniref:hypothetical protein n=1 Tax=Leptolyngbya sp. GB1-A1 TaxID=2933908 RepID=UPI00329782C3